MVLARTGSVRSSLLRTWGMCGLLACAASSASAQPYPGAENLPPPTPAPATGLPLPADLPPAAVPGVPEPIPVDKLVSEVRVEGNKTVTMHRIQPHLRLRAGRPFDFAMVENDVRALLATRLFVDVKPMYEPGPNGVVVIFRVVERPLLTEVKYIGNKGLKEKSLAKETGIKVGDSVDPSAVADARRKLEELYARKGFNHVRVSVLEGTEPEHRRAIFQIHEGPRQRVQGISFVGNQVVTDARLKTLLTTKGAWFWYLGGEFDPDKLDLDVDKLLSYYHSLGYWSARVSREVNLNEEQTSVYVQFVVDEGPRFKVREINVIGNKKYTNEKLLTDVKLTQGKFFQQNDMQLDVNKIKDLYGSDGHIFCDVQPDIRFLEEPGLLDIVYQIDEGAKYRVGRINVVIDGEYPHTKITTVLNRLSIRPGDVVDIRELRASERRLKSAGLFKVDPSRNVSPKIVFGPPRPGSEDKQLAGRPGGSMRGQDPGSSVVGSATPAQHTYSSSEQLPPGSVQPGERLIDVTYVEELEAPSQPIQVDGPGLFDTRAPVQAQPAGLQSSEKAQQPFRASAVLNPSPYEVALSPALPTAEDPLLLSIAQHWQLAQLPASEVEVGAVSQWAWQASERRAEQLAQYQVQPQIASHRAGYPPVANYPSGAATPIDVLARPRPVTAERRGATLLGQDAGYGGRAMPSQPGAPVYSYSTPSYAQQPTEQVPPGQPAAYRQPEQVPPGFRDNVLPAPGAGAPIVGGPVGPGLPNPGDQQPFLDGVGEPVELRDDPLQDFDIVVEETETGRLMFGVGVNSDAGVVGNVVIDEQNFDWRRFPRGFEDFRNGTAFRGAGQRFRLEAAPGTQVSRYVASWTDPYVFDTANSLGLSGSYYERQFRDWDEERVSGRISIGRNITADLSASMSARAEQIDITNPRTPTPPELQEVIGSNSLYGLRFAMVHDTRDSSFLATEGHYVELGLEQVLGDFDYPRASVEWRQYFLMHERADGSGRHTLSLKGSASFTGSDTPIYDNYFAGGFTTIRGFSFRGASPQNMGVQVGGEFMLLGSIEYLFPITADDMLRGVIFVDSGTVEEDVRIDGNSFRCAPGIGLRIQVPALGPAPIALDFAFPVMTAEGDDEQIFNFYVGAAR